MTAESIEEAVKEALGPDERMIAFASVLEGAAPDALEPAAVVLTSHRLMMVASANPSGYETQAAYERSTCSLVNHKALPDDSTFLIVRHRSGLLYIHFAGAWQAEAGLVRDALMAKELKEPQEAEEPKEAQQPAQEAEVADLPVDRIALSQEFAGLFEGLDEAQEE